MKPAWRAGRELAARAVYFAVLMAISLVFGNEVIVWLVLAFLGTALAAYFVGHWYAMFLPFLLIPAIYIVFWHLVSSESEDGEGIARAILSPMVWLLMFVAAAIGFRLAEGTRARPKV